MPPWRSYSIPFSLSQPIHDLGASFFFAKYCFNESPVFTGYHGWLAESYLTGKRCHILQAAIDAVGLAGLSNVSSAPYIEAKSKERYCDALNALKQLLNDPAEAVADTTLLAVNLLTLYEVFSPVIY